MSPRDIAASYPWISFTLILIFVSGPQWLSGIWGLFSSDPLAPLVYNLAGSLNMNLPMWSPFWITVPLGFAMFAYLVYVLKTRDGNDPNKIDTAFVQTIKRFALDPNARMKALFILWMGLAIWLLTINAKVSTLRDDVDCIVMPRHLNRDQISKMAEYLSRHEPSEISLYQVEGDEEAGAYRGDIYMALKEGGWKILAVNQVPQNQAHSDMFMEYKEPLQVPPPEEDPKHPRPHTILEQALRHAEVMFGGAGGGASQAFTNYSLSLTIGHRRRDTFACPEAIKKQRLEDWHRGIVQ